MPMTIPVSGRTGVVGSGEGVAAGEMVAGGMIVSGTAVDGAAVGVDDAEGVLSMETGAGARQPHRTRPNIAQQPHAMVV